MTSLYGRRTEHESPTAARKRRSRPRSSSGRPEAPEEKKSLPAPKAAGFRRPGRLTAATSRFRSVALTSPARRRGPNTTSGSLHSSETFSEQRASFSFDGRWISYTSDESGREELYVASFPGPGGKWQVSTEGVIAGGWCGSSNQIAYLTLDQNVRTVEVRTDSSSGFEATTPKTLFKIPRSLIGTPTPNCDRFLIAVVPQAPQSSSIALVSDWPALLKK
jgi:hypothetical protein